MPRPTASRAAPTTIAVEDLQRGHVATDDLGKSTDYVVQPMVPELDVERVLRWAGKRNRPEIRDQIRLEVDVDPNSITIFECRPPWNPELIGWDWTRLPIARLRFTNTKKLWTLYWRDRNLKFHVYDLVEPTVSIEELLAEIDRDPTSIFWG